MKRTFAAAVAVTASTSIWLAAAPAYGGPESPPMPRATIQVVPEWTYQGGGKLAVITACSQRGDIRVLTSTLLRHPVVLRGANLLIRVTSKTKPQKYAITLWCAAKSGRVDAMDVTWVTVLKRLPGWKQRPAPDLPPHFKPNMTVQSGPPAAVKTSHGKGHKGHKRHKRHAKKGHHGRQ
jgi:hypothetical protein